METIEVTPDVNIKIESPDHSIEDESQDGQSHHHDDDEGDSYLPQDSVKSESEESEIHQEDGDSSHGTLDDMEGTVIHFLAQKSISKTKVKSGMKAACRFKCDNCTSIFRYKSTLNYHLKSECGRKVIKGKALVEKPQGKVSCNICAKTLCSRTSLMVHMRIHTGERPFACPECKRSFFQKAHLVDHQAKMHTAARALCRLCNSTFADKYHLLMHMKEHKDTVTPFNCKVCNESFSTRASLSNHVAGRHAELRTTRSSRSSPRHAIDPNATECQDCGRSYSGPRQLRAHVRRAHRASLPCPHCPRLFPSGYDLRVHSRCHTGERPYSCEFCDRTFSRKSILDVHRTLHTGQKDFVCSICSKAFNRKSKLQVHFTEHTRQTIMCQICHKGFKCQSYLSSHMKTHSDEREVKVQLRKRPVPALTPLPALKNSTAEQVSPPSPACSQNDSESSSGGNNSVHSSSEECAVTSSGDQVSTDLLPLKVEIIEDDVPLDCSFKTH